MGFLPSLTLEVEPGALGWEVEDENNAEAALDVVAVLDEAFAASALHAPGEPEQDSGDCDEGDAEQKQTKEQQCANLMVQRKAVHRLIDFQTKLQVPSSWWVQAAHIDSLVTISKPPRLRTKTLDSESKTLDSESSDAHIVAQEVPQPFHRRPTQAVKATTSSAGNLPTAATSNSATLTWSGRQAHVPERG